MTHSNFAEKNNVYEKNKKLDFEHPTLSELTGNDIKSYKIANEKKYREWCPVCEIQYSKRKYPECPLCKIYNENSNLKKKNDEIEAAAARKEEQYTEYIKEILKYNRNMNEQNYNKVKKTVVTMGRYKGLLMNWLIICTDRMNGKVLLVSEKTIGLAQYNNKLENITWKDCTLRKWLNEQFFEEAFSKQEKKFIKLTKVVNNSGQNARNKCTNDFIFCLTIDEVKGYFAKDSYRSALGMDGEKNNWWLRSTAYGCVAPDVAYDGTIYESGCMVTDLCAVRPALWVDISYVEG